MKIKFLALAMIAMLFTACKPDPQPEGGEGTDTNNGDAESSYIAISIAADNMDRGGDGDEIFEDGDGLLNENAVKSVNVFFFRNGESFIINEAIGKNHQEVSFEFSDESDNTNNIEKISNSVLVINDHQGELPNQMVVVLNWNPTQNTYSLDQLKSSLTNHINNIEGTDYFVMSNSVYKDAAGNVYATPLAITDFKESAIEATNNPVQVYVERVAAKVRVKTPNVTDHKFELLNAEGGVYKVKVDDDETQVYAKITGWELYNDYQESYLLKNIEGLPAHNDEFNGFYWNSPSNHRSYWAISRTGYTEELDYKSITEYPTQKYCGENTNSHLDGDGVNKTLRTQVILTAELQDDNGNAIEIARWHGNDYIEKENLIIAVTNTLVNTYYTRTLDSVNSTTDTVYIYNSITKDDLTTVVGSTLGEKEYEVYVQLKDDTQTWYKRNGSDFVKISFDNLNTELKAIVGEALLYESGKTYYFTDIKHFGDTYGVVRNHIYDININSIKGLGTPVVSGNTIIETPEIPEDNATYVAAQINILSWNLVTNDVDL